MGNFTPPKHPDSTYQKRLRRISKGKLEPKSNEIVKGGVYDSLTISDDVNRVTLIGVTVLGEVKIEGLAISGTIYVPVSKRFPHHTRFNRDNPLEVYPKSLLVLAKQVGQADDEL